MFYPDMRCHRVVLRRQVGELERQLKQRGNSAHPLFCLYSGATNGGIVLLEADTSTKLSK
jgi:hypothetical protein